MTGDTTSPCTGQSALFDRTDARSHAEARAICAGCPVINACRNLLRHTQATQLVAGPSGGPEGTWAGVLLLAKGKVA